MVDWDYLEHTAARVKERKARGNETLAAEEKSLRKYSTAVFPPLRERWDYWFHTGQRKREVLQSNSYEWLKGNVDNWAPNAMMSTMLQSMYDYDEPEFGRAIEVKVSATTFVDGLSVRELVKDELNALCARLGKIPTLSDLATSILGWSVVFDLFKDVKASHLFQGINDLFKGTNFSFPATSRVKIDGRRIKPDLIMCVKYYPNRDDNRAYCKDLNLLRSLAGAALQRLILPKSMRQRRNLDWVQRVCPARNKDKLNIRVSASSEKVHLAVIIDISNFTGSAANAWLMLSCMALELAHGKIRGKPANLYCCDGVHFTATLVEVLVLYLYTTVGYPCQVEATSEYRTLPGGFLGVNANISVALLFYSILLLWLSRNRPNYIHYMKSQAGGDDVFILLKISRKNAELARMWLHKNLTNYVGYVKELNTFIVEDSTQTKVVDGIKFCRKRVGVTKQDTYYNIKSEPAVPLNEVITSETIPSKPQAQQKLWETARHELSNFARENVGYEWMTDSLLSIVASRLPRANITRTISAYAETDLELQLVEARYCSVNSINLATSVPPIFHLSNIYYGSVEQSIQFLLARGQLVMQLVRYQGTLYKAVMTENEGKYYRRFFKTKMSVHQVIQPNDSVVSRLTK